MLPITPILPGIVEHLAKHNNLVLQAPPGAGKTTLVPLALFDQPWVRGRKILMLEPRRLATRAAATRMADLLGEELGERVGYRVRLEGKTSARTQIEVVTEGILTRRLVHDPELKDVAAILFDEFHERSIHADLGLALALECQSVLRDDLRIVVMSATLDGQAVSQLLGDAAIITAEGRSFPVTTRYLDQFPSGRIEWVMADQIRELIRREDGSILAFLPGAGEIERTRAALQDLSAQLDVHVLYGALPPQQQRAAIAPAPGNRRKLVLATSIAETALTIEGIKIVVDSGLSRLPVFDPGSGMSRLQTVKVSKAAADQRQGRAGRLGPGVCLRLWPEAAHGSLPAYAPPEIMATDLTPLALDLAAWGILDPHSMKWLNPPPDAAYSEAVTLLKQLGALDDSGRITDHGKEMSEAPLHPRLAHLLVQGKRSNRGATAVNLAAILEEKDFVKNPNPAWAQNLEHPMEVLAGGRAQTSIDHAALGRVKDLIRQMARTAQINTLKPDPDQTGLALALAFPDRVAQARGAAGHYRMANGRGAKLDKSDPLAKESFLAIATTDGDKTAARIYSAAPLKLADIEKTYRDEISEVEAVRYDHKAEMILARKQRIWRQLVLREDPLPKPDPILMAIEMAKAVAQMGLHVLPFDDSCRNLQARLQYVRGLSMASTEWPDWSDEQLIDKISLWLAPHLIGYVKKSDLKKLPLYEILSQYLGHALMKELAKWAPATIRVPTGSEITIDYQSQDQPVLRVRLQELFGLSQSPRIGPQQQSLVIELLSPAHRPIAVTGDLASFWQNGYKQVRNDMKGRYPKHPWPEDPLAAEPTRRVKPKY